LFVSGEEKRFTKWSPGPPQGLASATQLPEIKKKWILKNFLKTHI
jgi:hypothetical protein